MESSDSIASIKGQRAVADSPKTLSPRSTTSRADITTLRWVDSLPETIIPPQVKA